MNNKKFSHKNKTDYVRFNPINVNKDSAISGKPDSFLSTQQNQSMFNENNYCSIIDPSDAPSLFEAIIRANSENIFKLTKRVFCRFQKALSSPEEIKEYICYLCYTLQSSLLNFQKNETAFSLYSHFKMICSDLSSVREMQHAFNQTLLYTTDCLFQSKNTPFSRDSISRIKEYIDQNYAQDVSLVNLSRRFYMSSSYISYLFKLNYGKSYSDYLKQVRLEQAKNLIETNPGLKVYEVCKLVGYKEYKYFSKQFKNAFGVTPSDIRETTKLTEHST